MAPAAPLALLTLLVGTTAGGADLRRTPVVEAVDRASPAVVNISTTQVVGQRRSPFPFRQDPFFEEFFRDFLDPRPRRFTRTSLGSGVIVGADGTIVTNLHVLLRAGRVTVTLADERELEARLVGADADSDLAVLRVDSGEALPSLPLGSSADLLIGETVIAIGNPFGLSHTVTTGVVSALDRSLQAGDTTHTGLIQTDASINPGNSGGPLLDIHGRLVGINTAIYGKAQGIGFAIPVDRVRRVMRELVSYGEVRRLWTGLVPQDLTPALARHFGTARGVVVAGVEPGSPAAEAGVERGDVVAEVDDHTVASAEELDRRIQDTPVGDHVALTVLRDGRERTLRLLATVFPTERADALAWERLGLRVAEDAGGLVVERVRADGPLARIGVRPGDRVLGLGGVRIRRRAELRRRMVEVRSARSVLLVIGRGPHEYNVQVPLAGG